MGSLVGSAIGSLMGSEVGALCIPSDNINSFGISASVLPCEQKGSIASRMGATVALRLLWVMMMPFIASVVL